MTNAWRRGWFKYQKEETKKNKKIKKIREWWWGVFGVNIRNKAMTTTTAAAVAEGRRPSLQFDDDWRAGERESASSLKY